MEKDYVLARFLQRQVLIIELTQMKLKPKRARLNLAYEKKCYVAIWQLAEKRRGSLALNGYTENRLNGAHTTKTVNKIGEEPEIPTHTSAGIQCQPLGIPE